MGYRHIAWLAIYGNSVFADYLFGKQALLSLLVNSAILTDFTQSFSQQPLNQTSLTVPTHRL